MPLTAEQQAVADAYTTGQDLIVQAGAGAGKTSTAVAAAQAAPGRRIAYLAFNRAVVGEAKTKFPRHVTSLSSHQLAFHAVGKRYKARLDGNKRVPSELTAKILGTEDLELDTASLSAVAVAQRAMDMVMKFCYSNDDHIHPGHLPHIPGLDDPQERRFAAKYLQPYAEKAWAELQQTRGKLKFDHDHYMKIYALSRPVLPFDSVLVDEAQDVNPALGGIIDNQFGVQRVLIGDAQQQLYSWRGAVDSMSTFDADAELWLTQSWRFGPHVADEANVWLELLGTGLRLSGTPSIDSRIAPIDDTPDAVLCRTNGGAISNLMHFQAEGIPVAIVGAGPPARALAQAAKALKDDGKRPESGELCMFGSWDQVRRYVREDSAGSDLSVFVRLVDTYGADAIIRAVDRAVKYENQARVVVTTCHRAKGREWNRVLIDEDWATVIPGDNDGAPKEVKQEDLRACYVAVTRAKQQLDLGPLQQVKEAALANAVAAV